MSSIILHGDCLDICADIPDNSIDMIFTSPPYANRRNHAYGGVPPSQYVDWFLPRAEQFKRVLRETGSFVLNIKEHGQDGEKSLYVYRLVIAMREQLKWKYIDDFCWVKTNVIPGHHNTRLRDGWEHVYHFAHHRNGFVFNRREVMVPSRQSAKKRLGRLREGDFERRTSSTGSGLARGSTKMNSKMVYPNNVLHLAPSNANLHSAAGPLALPRWFIRLMSNEGDIVMDPFAGSGTTLVAANELGRKGVGIDMDEESCRIMRERTKQNIITFNGGTHV